MNSCDFIIDIDKPTSVGIDTPVMPCDCNQNATLWPIIAASKLALACILAVSGIKNTNRVFVMYARNLLILCLIMGIKLANGAWPDLPYEFNSCDFYYDIDNPTEVGMHAGCTGTTVMPCDCDSSAYLTAVSTPNTMTTFTLTDNSYLDMGIQVDRGFNYDDYYQITRIRFAVTHAIGEAVLMNETSSYIEVHDANTGDWTRARWHQSTLGNVTFLEAGDMYFLDEITSYQFRTHFVWDTPTLSTFVTPAYLIFQGRYTTLEPTTAPTNNPSVSPTKNPTVSPTKNPTLSPSPAPTMPPTAAPSASPTFTIVQRQTKQYPGVDFFNYSDNIIPLDSRGNGNITYNNYHLPDVVKPNGDIQPGDERPYCITCILAWGDIDASIELEGCPNTTYNYSSVNPNDPNSIYHCHNGTWILKTSGRLADWQDTYGRLEIWEVDDRDVKWLHAKFEFNWWNKSCFIIDDDPETPEVETIDCPVLPLTGTQNQAAYFEFTLPKKYGDSRTAPLVVVWYDLLSIPYSIKPELGYKYTNFTLYVPTQGVSFGLDDAMSDFAPGLVAAGILCACFAAVMILSCFVSGSRKRKSDFMIDTRNLKTTFRHTPETIIVPPSEIENRARFSCARHGPWLLVVLVARLIYMFIFTFTFFYLLFQRVNKAHYDTLGQYDLFAVGRDAQLVEYSQGIEMYYANESARMDKELESRDKYCYDMYLNKTGERYVTGGKNQADYHNQQINNPMGNISVNFSDVQSIYLLGDGQTACNLESATIWVNSKQGGFTYRPEITQERVNVSSPTNATYVVIVAGNVTELLAHGYDTSFANFSEVEAVLGPICEQEDWCYGWGFFDRDGTNSPYYVMLNDMGDPAVDEGVSGICYGVTKLDAAISFLTFNSSFFDDYADKLNAQYLEDFQSYADDLYDTVQGLWSALQDFPTDVTGEALGTTNSYHFTPYENYSENAGYGIDFDWINTVGTINAVNGTIMDHKFRANIKCKDCPQGNFTQSFLDQATAYLFNSSNYTDYTNLSNLPVNFSNLISINTAFIEFPDLPTIELPFDFDFPIDLGFLANICISLDILLLIYRWYRTTGIVARIVRGKDVEVGLSYLMVNQSKPRCCYGRSIMDYCLNFIIYCHDFIFRLGYNCWRLFYWGWYLLQIAIVGLLVWMMYALVDQILTVEFIEGIGAFQLMTVGLGAQRTVRNQVLCATALSYNNYTLTTMERSIGDYARERNDDAWQRNLAELARVDSFNGLFCHGWVAYQTATRDVTRESPNKAWVNLAEVAPVDILQTQRTGTYFTYNASDPGFDETGIDELFDKDESTYWAPYANNSAPIGTNMTFDFHFSPIYMTQYGDWTWWDIMQVSFDWRFIYDTADGAVNVSFEVYVDANNSGVLEEIAYPNGHTYGPLVLQAGNSMIRQTTESTIKIISIPQEINTPMLRIVLTDVDEWGTEYYLNGISIAGHAPASKVICPEVKFRFWEFDASPTNNENASAEVRDTPTAQNPDATTYYDADGTYVELCPQITPIHGYMYRGFVRSWLNEQLIIGHEPFILALRNIALSPFFIAVALIGILFMAYLFAFLMEWFLMKLDLFRENPYAKVPLVTTSYDKYDTDLHETAGNHGTIYGNASVGKDYYRPTTSKEEESGNLLADKHVDRNEIEMGLSSQVTVRGKNKKKSKVPGESAGDTYTAPEEEAYEEYDC